MIRLLVCGGRAYADYEVVERALDRVHAELGISLLIEGGASGADSLARFWASRHGVPNNTYEVNHDVDGPWPAAGHCRNQRMLSSSKPDKVVAFPGGNGTADMVRRARKAGLKVWEIKD